MTRNEAEPAERNQPEQDTPVPDDVEDVPSGTVMSEAGQRPAAVVDEGSPAISGVVLPAVDSGGTGDSAPPDNGVAEAVARLTDENLPPAERRRLLGQLANAMRGRGFKELFRPTAAMTWVAETVTEVAPHVPIRTADMLNRHFPGLDQEQLADRLVRNAARTTAGIGAMGGGVAAIEWVVPPTLLTAPVLLAAETVAVVAVEIKLIGELQEAYGYPVPGTGAQRAVSLVQAWAGRRGVNLMVPGRGMAAALGTAARFELRDRLLRRFGRNLTTLGPLLTGAAVAGYLNRRATVNLGAEIRKDLAGRVDPPGPPEIRSS